jgi:hypothetical protein
MCTIRRYVRSVLLAAALALLEAALVLLEAALIYSDLQINKKKALYMGCDDPKA